MYSKLRNGTEEKSVQKRSVFRLQQQQFNAIPPNEYQLFEYLTLLMHNVIFLISNATFRVFGTVQLGCGQWVVYQTEEKESSDSADIQGWRSQVIQLIYKAGVTSKTRHSRHAS
jgi:hypothetical protein